MTNIYPTRTVYIDLDNDDVPETNITAKITSDISGQNGTLNSKETDRISPSGSISFEIDNDDQTYTGLEFVGKAVAIKLSYVNREKQIFYGHIAPGYDMGSGDIAPLRIKVTVQDWMHTANQMRLQGLEVATSQRYNEALDTLMGSVTIPPTRTEFDVGDEIFPNMFDGSGSKAKVYSELNKLMNSEIGLLYIKHRPDGDGEVLRAENMFARGSLRPLSRVPSEVTTPPFLKFHGNAGASGFLKFHGNAAASGKIKVHKAVDATFDALHYGAEWKVGKSLTNDVTITNVFRNVDTADVILYELTYPLKIGTGETVTIRGDYADPEGGTTIQAFDVSLNLADVAFNSRQDGTGTDLKANLFNAGFAFFSSHFTRSYRNAGPAGYLTSFIVRGKGIYKYSPNTMVIENEESKTALRMEVGETLAREYSSDLDTSKMFGNRVLAMNRMPRREMLSASYHGNIDEKLLMAFMHLEQGDKIRIPENFPDYTGEYYIQGARFRIGLNGILDFTWFLKEEIESMCTPIAISAPEAGGISAVDFGILPYLSNMERFTYTFWIKKPDATPAPYFYVLAKEVDQGTGRRGHGILVANDDDKIYFESYKTPTDGEWSTTNVVLSAADTWYHVAISYDNTTDAADPEIYVNGSAVAVTERDTPSGTSDDDSDCPLIFFTAGPDAANPANPYLTDSQNFTLKDVRIYNRILSPAEVAEIAAGEDDYSTVQEGLLFCGPFAPTDNIDDYIGDTIEADDLVLDIVHGAAGVPYNETTATSATMLTGETI
jgi:hypothetical protein